MEDEPYVEEIDENPTESDVGLDVEKGDSAKDI
jgi:hypothetical protein